MYKILYAQYLNCIDDHYGNYKSINDYFKPSSNKDNFTKKFTNVKFVSTEEAISLICERMKWRLISVNEGKIYNGFDGFILIFEEKVK